MLVIAMLSRTGLVVWSFLLLHPPGPWRGWETWKRFATYRGQWIIEAQVLPFDLVGCNTFEANRSIGSCLKRRIQFVFRLGFTTCAVFRKKEHTHKTHFPGNHFPLPFDEDGVIAWTSGTSVCPFLFAISDHCKGQIVAGLSSNVSSARSQQAERKKRLCIGPIGGNLISETDTAAFSSSTSTAGRWRAAGGHDLVQGQSGEPQHCN